jgi:hypothetical protein
MWNCETVVNLDATLEEGVELLEIDYAVTARAIAASTPATDSHNRCESKAALKWIMDS